MGGTGLEPVTPSLSSRPQHSPAFAVAYSCSILCRSFRLRAPAAFAFVRTLSRGLVVAPGSTVGAWFDCGSMARAASSQSSRRSDPPVLRVPENVDRVPDDVPDPAVVDDVARLDEKRERRQIAGHQRIGSVHEWRTQARPQLGGCAAEQRRHSAVAVIDVVQLALAAPYVFPPNVAATYPGEQR